MASRFSGTSSFKPAVDQEITLIKLTSPEILNEGRLVRNKAWDCSCVNLLTFQEVLHLIPHLAGQSVLGQQVEIMHLVFIGYSDLSSP